MGYSLAQIGFSKWVSLQTIIANCLIIGLQFAQIFLDLQFANSLIIGIKGIEIG